MYHSLFPGQARHRLDPERGGHEVLSADQGKDGRDSGRSVTHQGAGPEERLSRVRPAGVALDRWGCL